MPFAKGRPFLKGQSGSVATQFKPGHSGNPRGRPKGRHAFIMRLRIPASLRKSLKLPLGATYEDVIAFARTAAENPLRNAGRGKLRFASVIRVQVRRRSPKPPLVWLNRNSASRIEARALLVMVGRQDTTLETVRELISVPPEVEALLRAYALANPGK